MFAAAVVNDIVLNVTPYFNIVLILFNISGPLGLLSSYMACELRTKSATKSALLKALLGGVSDVAAYIF